MRYWTVEQAWASLRRFFPSLSPVEQEISAALYCALAQGCAVPAEALARAAGLDTADLNKVLARWPGLERDARGRITAYWGMSLAETPHRLAFGERAVYAMCAWDALFIPHVVGQAARLRSRCAQTWATIILEVGPRGAEAVHAPSPVLSFMPPGPCDTAAETARKLTGFVHFFSAEAAASDWVALHPGARLMTLAAACELAGRRNEARHRGRWSRELSPPLRGEVEQRRCDLLH